jgi:hypothetical protein
MKTLHFEKQFTTFLAVLIGCVLQVQAQQRGGGGFGGFGGFGGGGNAARSTSSGSSQNTYSPNGSAGYATFSVDPSSGNLIVIGDATAMENISQVIANLDRPKPQVLITVAPALGESAIRETLQHAGASDLDVRLLDGIDYEMVQAADAALVTSGTATLEMACLNVPMVVAYRGSFGTWVQYKIVSRGGRLPFISLPNILANAPVVPELLQEDASPAGLAHALTPLLADTPARQAQLQAFDEIRAHLGDGHACARTAELILELLQR